MFSIKVLRQLYSFVHSQVSPGSAIDGVSKTNIGFYMVSRAKAALINRKLRIIASITDNICFTWLQMEIN